MHIALGVNDSHDFPIKKFLNAANSSVKTVRTEPDHPIAPRSQLTFSGNPKRRRGEWRINDQFHHRHPAWNPRNGFPTVYSPNNKPIVVIAKLGNRYHVRFLREAQFPLLPDRLSARLSSEPKGIIKFHPSWASALKINLDAKNLKLYEAMVETADTEGTDEFMPLNDVDGRERIVTEVIRRQGQQSFRKKLLKVYNGVCAITKSSVEVALQAAHISPYRGPQTNHVTNGILLRADLHTLFDLGFITINPGTFKVRVSSLLAKSEYRKLSGRKIFLPANPKKRPSSKALGEHNKIFKE